MTLETVDYPIIEAVCEFKPASDTKWDLTIPGLIYRELGDTFPEKEERSLQNVEIKPTEKGLQQKLTRDNRVLFFMPDKKIFFQIGKKVMAIHCVKPYPKWGQFKPTIAKVYNTLRGIVAFDNLERIGLRYINRIEIPNSPTALKESFEFRPSLSEDLLGNLNSFFLGCEFNFSEGNDSCRVQLTKTDSEGPDTLAFILDIDYFLSKANSVTADNALDWVEKAKGHVNDIFKKCITEKLKNSFKEV